MERLRIVKSEEAKPAGEVNRGPTTDPLERFKAAARDPTEKALEMLNRISAKEMSQSEPRAEIIEDSYLLYHYLDFLKRFASSKR